MNRHIAYSGNADRLGVEIIGLMAYRQLQKMINWASRDTCIKMDRIRKGVTFLPIHPGAGSAAGGMVGAAVIEGPMT